MVSGIVSKIVSDEKQLELTGWTCKICGAEGSTGESWKEHLWGNHPEFCWRDMMWTCERCTYRTHKRDDAERHMRSRHHRMLRWFNCDECNWMSGTWEKLREHKHQHHPG